MIRLLGGFLILLLCSFAAADDKPKQKEKDPSPKAKFDSLVKEFREAQSSFFKSLQEAGSPEEQQKRMKSEVPKLDKVLVKFVEFAEKHSSDPLAVDALTQVIQDNFTSRLKGTTRKKAIDLLTREHVTSDKIGLLCQGLTQGYDKSTETLLRAILDKNKNKSVQADACLALAQNLQQRARIARMLVENPALASRAEEAFGKETAEALKKTDSDQLDKDSAKMFGIFAKQHAGQMNAERLSTLIQQLSFQEDKGSEALVRTLLKHEKTEIQGQACLALAQILKKQAESAQEKDAKKAATLLVESESLFNKALKDYASIKMGFRGTVGDKAKSELYELKYLTVGKEAPEVEGEDQDGKKFKLSDYKGKVVLLDFWNQF